MAILSKKSNTDEAVTESKTVTSKKTTSTLRPGVIIGPRISEKSVRVGAFNQYIFKVNPKANKVEIKKALESYYGIKIEKVNVISIEGKSRNYGRTSGKMSDYKKAIVTLTKDSKKPAFSAE